MILPNGAHLLLLGVLVLLAGCGAARLDLRPVVEAAGQQWQPGEAPADAYSQGKQHLEEGHIGFALQAFRAALMQDSHSVRTLNALAISYDQLGRHDLALRYFARALEVDPGSPQTLNNLGYASLRRGDAEGATRYFRRALDGNDAHPTIQANLQIADSWLGDMRQSVRLAGAPGEPVQVLPTSWVERTSPTVQTLVTRPDPTLLAQAAQLLVDPRLVSYQPDK